uniref:Uncharacterized protein n=1 Tax=Octopus bimaculoides TaxID=37653 RepID=A0A0L8HB48_OCTBM
MSPIFDLSSCPVVLEDIPEPVLPIFCNIVLIIKFSPLVSVTNVFNRNCVGHPRFIHVIIS